VRLLDGSVRTRAITLVAFLVLAFVNAHAIEAGWY
jgi:hypothetical protein